MNIQLSDHFGYRKLFHYTLPSILMMIFTSVYSVVDGFFVSNFVGKTPFAAVNFIIPFLMILGSLGFMFGTGGSALIAKTMGEGKQYKARQLFSLFLYVTITCSIIIAVPGFFLIRPIAALMGADERMLDYCVVYGRIILPVLPAYVLQYEFQSFFPTSGKPHLGLVFTITAGVTNMVLDALLVAVLRLGLPGAAAATASSQIIGGIAPLIYFARPNTSLFRLTKTKFDGKAIRKACANGSSELMSNVSMSAVNILYNGQLMKYAGEDGVAAYGVLMYVEMIFLAIFIGYSVGTAPITSFHYGAANHAELKSLRQKGLIIISIVSIAMLLFANLLARPLAEIFVGYEPALLQMTQNGFMIYSFCFLFAGIAIYGSAFFTALNNGLISALISFLRTLLFQVGTVLIFPLFWGINGIWFSIVAAEMMAAVVTVLFLIIKQKQYHY